jgi:predicted SprT family Zn-dependent metalloprotease
MARLSKYESSSGEDEFPDINILVQRASKKSSSKENYSMGNASKATKPAPVKAPSVRRRKLGQLSDNLLLKPWSHDGDSGLNDTPPSTFGTLQPSISRPRVQLRAKKQEAVVQIKTKEEGMSDEQGDASGDEVTFIEEATVDDSSDFNETLDFYSAEEDWTPSFSSVAETPKLILPVPHKNSQAKPQARKTVPPTRDDTLLPRSTGPTKAKENRLLRPSKTSKTGEKNSCGSKTVTKAGDDMTDLLQRMDINDVPPREKPPTRKASGGRPKTPPPTTPPKARPTGLVSPSKKLSRIPTTPHHPSSDLFWSREFVDDWNDEHSPKKQLFPDASRSPAKPSNSPKKKPTADKTASDRGAKKAFEQAKHDTAARFLRELDTTITQGRIAELAASTGGVKLLWSNKLNTTAGRANWKRETVRSTKPDGAVVVVRVNHHASIELAEKVIDSEPRLLNVLAHEFCHLANFMISGVTNNPHGKEFKAWAARCSEAFGPRGIDVTTKHSYDIDFKYIWECVACATEYKRHSRSIDPKRHRCGNPACKGELKQIKPTPRAGTGKASEYQVFMKEQMKVLKEENPTSPQKEIMRLVADRWSTRRGASKGAQKEGGGGVAGIATALIDLTLEDGA